jgi:hypothetical protein
MDADTNPQITQICADTQKTGLLGSLEKMGTREAQK